MEGKKVDERIFEALSLGLNKLQFAVVKLESCSGTGSVQFSEVSCEYEVLLHKNKLRPCFFPFTLMFEKGVSMLKTLEEADNEEIEDVDGHMTEAILRLNKFYKAKEFNEKCLKNVFDMRRVEETTVSKTDITTALAEHLLGELTPGGSYIVDSKVRGKRGCRCGCKVVPVFDDTGVGHEKVWHGFVDIIMSSHPGISSVANVVLESEENPTKKRKLEDTKNDASAGENMIREVKPVLPEYTQTQAMAQTIVFSLVQKQKHPGFSHHIVPNIVISPTKVEIMMYDADKDILLWSNPIPLFNTDLGEDRTLIDETIVILWMVLHYRVFCADFCQANPYLLERCKSNFKELVKSKWDIYSKSLESRVSNFPSKLIKRPISELIQVGISLDLESDDF